MPFVETYKYIEKDTIKQKPMNIEKGYMNRIYNVKGFI